MLVWMNDNNLALLVPEWMATLPAATVAKPPVSVAVADAYVRGSVWALPEGDGGEGLLGQRGIFRHAYYSRALRGLGGRSAATASWKLAVESAHAQPDKLEALARETAKWGWKSQSEEILWSWPRAKRVPDGSRIPSGLRRFSGRMPRCFTRSASSSSRLSPEASPRAIVHQPRADYWPGSRLSARSRRAALSGASRECRGRFHLRIFAFSARTRRGGRRRHGQIFPGAIARPGARFLHGLFSQPLAARMKGRSFSGSARTRCSFPNWWRSAIFSSPPSTRKRPNAKGAQPDSALAWKSALQAAQTQPQWLEILGRHRLEVGLDRAAGTAALKLADAGLCPASAAEPLWAAGLRAGDSARLYQAAKLSPPPIPKTSRRGAISSSSRCSPAKRAMPRSVWRKRFRARIRVSPRPPRPGLFAVSSASERQRPGPASHPPAGATSATPAGALLQPPARRRRASRRCGEGSSAGRRCRVAPRGKDDSQHAPASPSIAGRPIKAGMAPPRTPPGARRSPEAEAARTCWKPWASSRRKWRLPREPRRRSGSWWTPQRAPRVIETLVASAEKRRDSAQLYRATRALHALNRRISRSATTSSGWHSSPARLPIFPTLLAEELHQENPHDPEVTATYALALHQQHKTPGRRRAARRIDSRATADGPSRFLLRHFPQGHGAGRQGPGVSADRKRAAPAARRRAPAREPHVRNRDERSSIIAPPTSPIFFAWPRIGLGRPEDRAVPQRRCQTLNATHRHTEAALRATARHSRDHWGPAPGRRLR